MKFAIFYLLDGLLLFFGGEGETTVDHGVQNDSGGPDVDGEAIASLAAVEHLRGQVDQGA